MAGWHLEHTYAELPQLFYSPAAPTAVRGPRLAAFNRPLPILLGLEPEALEGPEGAAIFAGNAVPEGGRPIAQAYAGHQFGHFTALGDGRAILLGEQITPSGDRVDIQLKGAGQTRFSRRGEAGHRRLLEKLALKPLLDLGMRLGEASGACLAINIVRAALECHARMANFAEAGVSSK